jgi:hypothetical protein
MRNALLVLSALLAPAHPASTASHMSHATSRTPPPCFAPPTCITRASMRRSSRPLSRNVSQRPSDASTARRLGCVLVGSAASSPPTSTIVGPPPPPVSPQPPAAPTTPASPSVQGGTGTKEPRSAARVGDTSAMRYRARFTTAPSASSCSFTGAQQRSGWAGSSSCGW